MLLLLLHAAAAAAQPKERTFSTDTGTVVVRYFASGQVSTKEWRDKDDRWGRSWAYAKNGAVIFEGQTRRFAGHASVRFSYHPNGAVSKAETSDAPDGGIQWYRSTTIFDEEGNRTGFWEQGHDDYGPLPRPTMPPRTFPPSPSDPRAPGQPGHVEPSLPPCQRLFINEVFLVNATRQAGKAKVKALHPSPALKDGDHTLAPGDTVRLGSYSMGEAFAPPEKQLSVEVRRALRNKRRVTALGVMRTDHEQIGTDHRRYYLVVRGWDR